MTSEFALKSFAVTSYRGFAPSTSVELAPLTLVYGQNSAGKSSLVRLVASIAEAIRIRSRHPLIPMGHIETEGNFREFVGDANNLAIDLNFGGGSEPDVSLSFQITYFPESNQAKVTELRLLRSGQGVALAQLVRSSASNSSDLYRIVDFDGNIHAEQSTISFHGLLPYFESDRALAFIHEAMDKTTLAMQEFAKNLVWIGPLRRVPSRDVKLTQYPEIFASDGSNLPQLLHPANPGAEALTKRVSSWYEQSMGHLLTVEASTSGGRDVFTIFLAPIKQPHLTVPIVAHGAGMSQVLPVIILCGLAAESKNLWLLLENPELHLHDAIHEDLANLFIKVAKSNASVRLIAETHSENILLAAQLDSVMSTDSKLDVQVNWVQKNDAGQSVSTAFQFDRNGSLGGLWSKSIFGYTGQLARRIIEARTQQKKAADAN